MITYTILNVGRIKIMIMIWKYKDKNCKNDGIIYIEERLQTGGAK